MTAPMSGANDGGSSGFRGVLRTLHFTLLGPGRVVVLLPAVILLAGSLLSRIPGRSWLVGVVPILTGVIVYCSCAWQFTFTGKGTPWPRDPTKVFVAKGLYRLTRNPMFIGILLILVGEAIVFRSVALLVYTFYRGHRFNSHATAEEEPRLRRDFGTSYEEYCRRVPRWIGVRRMLSAVTRRSPRP